MIGRLLMVLIAGVLLSQSEKIVYSQPIYGIGITKVSNDTTLSSPDSNCVVSPRAIFGYMSYTKTLFYNKPQMDSTCNTKVSLLGSYNNPVWLSSFSYTKLTNTPAIADSVSVAILKANHISDSVKINNVAATTTSNSSSISTLNLNNISFGNSISTLNTNHLTDSTGIINNTNSINTLSSSTISSLNGLSTKYTIDSAIIVAIIRYGVDSNAAHISRDSTKIVANTASIVTNSNSITTLVANHVTDSTLIAGHTTSINSLNTSNTTNTSSINTLKTNHTTDSTLISLSATIAKVKADNIVLAVANSTLSNGVGVNTAGTGIGITGSGTNSSPYVASILSRTTTSRGSITFGTGVKPSTTRDIIGIYSITITTAVNLITLGVTGQVFIETSPDNSTWTTVGEVENSQTLAVSISVGLTSVNTLQLQAFIPTGYYVRLRTNGTGTFAYKYGFETTI